MTDWYAEEFYQEESTNGTPFVGVTERMQLSSVSTALLLAVGIGIFEAFALYFGSGWFLNLMGIPLVGFILCWCSTFALQLLEYVLQLLEYQFICSKILYIQFVPFPIVLPILFFLFPCPFIAGYSKDIFMKFIS